MSVKIQTAEKIDHPVLMEACQKKAPKGYRPVRQFIRRTVQDAVRWVRTNMHFEDVVAIPGHFQLMFKGSERKLTWCNYGALAFVKGEPKVQVETARVVTSRQVKDPKTKKLVAAIRDPKGECSSCGESTTVVQTGMCAICTWGDNDW